LTKKAAGSIFNQPFEKIGNEPCRAWGSGIREWAVGLIVAVDTGGTFTDLVAYNSDERTFVYSKSLTTYNDLVHGVADAIVKAKIDLRAADLVKFGTTLVINTYIQQNGARTALVTTEGFRDVLATRRGNRPFAFDLHYHRNPALVPREWRLELRERLGADGSVLIAPDEASLAALAKDIEALDVEAVAVSFINSYVDSKHEDLVVAYLRQHLSNTYVTSGTEISREWYEYERTSTAAANAYVGPPLKKYIHGLDGFLRNAGFEKTFFMMASNGGVVSVDRAIQQPVMLVESGPVGGCIGACVYARELKIPKMIAFDMGGTTAKCAVIENGSFEIKSPYYVGGYDFGFPINGAVLDIVEVGAGGGSIAWIDGQSRLSVGPMSAGSSPGPVAYGRGGTAPTITDANLVLGRLGASSFLGGEMQLDLPSAAIAIKQSVAEPLGYVGDTGLDQAASGILALGVVTMAGAIKQVTIERGLDPRDFVLFPFGGGGPLHAATLARELDIPEIVIPPEPGNFSALGMLVSDARVNETHTFLGPLDPASVTDMLNMFRQIEHSMGESIIREVGSKKVLFERAVEMRYRGQKQSIRIDIGNADAADAIRAAFNTTYARRYGHVDEISPIEFVGLHVAAVAQMPRPDLRSFVPKGSESKRDQVTSRPVYFPELGKRVDTPVFQRRELAPGFSHHGPAIIEEYGSTTVVGPNDHFKIGELAEIRITVPQVVSDL
jgi:N-methylhydantoinase A